MTLKNNNNQTTATKLITPIEINSKVDLPSIDQDCAETDYRLGSQLKPPQPGKQIQIYTYY